MVVCSGKCVWVGKKHVTDNSRTEHTSIVSLSITMFFENVAQRNDGININTSSVAMGVIFLAVVFKQENLHVG